MYYLLKKETGNLDIGLSSMDLLVNIRISSFSLCMYPNEKMIKKANTKGLAPHKD